MGKKKLSTLSGVIFITVIFLGALQLTGTNGSTTIYVPGDYSTIQAAIEAAESGDTVQVAGGTYSSYTNGEVFPLIMKNGVSLIGAGADVCILDAENTNRVIYCEGISDTETRIEGFAVTNGKNLDHFGGGGIYCYNSSPKILNNIISNNVADYGGGIYCNWYSSPTISNNVISGNRANERYGAIACYNYCDAIISNNTIANNWAKKQAGIYCWFSLPEIKNNIISNNTSPEAHGGIICSQNSHAVIINNTIVYNSAGLAGGIFAKYASPTVVNCILWGNGDDIEGCNATYSCIEITDDEDQFGAGLFNISDDPLLEKTNPYNMAYNADNWDCYLQPGSPCIDTGDNSVWPDWEIMGYADFEDDPRVYDGDGIDSDVVDMGADEYIPTETNDPPVAICKDVTIYIEDNGVAYVESAYVDGGSYDPNGDDIELSVDPEGPFSPGVFSVTLTVTDTHGAFATCQAEVTVEDNTPPEININGPICENVGKGKEKMANKISFSASDNCSGTVEATIKGVGIFNNGGKLVKGGGVYYIDGSDIFIFPDGNGWSIKVTVTADDEFGNSSTVDFTKALLKCKK